MVTSTDGAIRKPGRPRSAQAHKAILQAALELLSEEGYNGMSLEGVAERAGVGKTTIYRRWDSKEKMVIDAIRSLHAQAPIIDTGNLRNDLITILQSASVLSSSMVTGLLFKALSEVKANPAIFQAFQEQLIAPRFQRLFQMVECAQARGEIRRDVDPSLVVGIVAGPFFYYLLFAGMGPVYVPPPHMAEQIIDAALYGLAPQADGSNRA